jgi:hypothetical protein
MALSKQREGRKANLRDNLLKRRAELEMALMEFGAGESSETTRRSSVTAMSLQEELDEESDPLRVDLRLVETNAKEIESELTTLDETLTRRKEEVSRSSFPAPILPGPHCAVTPRSPLWINKWKI